MKQNPTHIRAATAEDVPLILTLVRALAEYEREPESAQLTEADLLRDGFGPAPAYSCLIAEHDGTACGFALFYPIYSTWAGRSLYLEDLFVQPAFRGFGIGKALLARVATIAAATGYARLDWSVLRWNEPAIGFYEGLGAIRLVEWEKVRLEGQALASLGRAPEPEPQTASQPAFTGASTHASDKVTA